LCCKVVRFTPSRSAAPPLKTGADFFNIFNHPQFGAPINYMAPPQFGFSTQTLNSWLGSGGLNPLYQVGGPRSVQLALKLQF